MPDEKTTVVTTESNGESQPTTADVVKAALDSSAAQAEAETATAAALEAQRQADEAKAQAEAAAAVAVTAGAVDTATVAGLHDRISAMEEREIARHTMDANADVSEMDARAEIVDTANADALQTQNEPPPKRGRNPLMTFLFGRG